MFVTFNDKCLNFKNPKTSSGATEFIADNKGHLLGGTNRGDSNPFGDFVGTWLVRFVNSNTPTALIIFAYQ
jgi:hypothetical protein